MESGLETMNSAGRKIYAQGDLDGACFLYSIVNAYAALTKKEPPFPNVCRAFRQVDFPQDFLSGNTGTTDNYDKNHSKLKENIERIISILGDERIITSQVFDNLLDVDLSDFVNDNSVLIVRYKGDSKFAIGIDHWVCVVAYEKHFKTMHIACSVRLQKACMGGNCDYREVFHQNFSRWSNDKLSTKNKHYLVRGESFKLQYFNDVL